MGFDELFETDRRHSDNYRQSEYRDEHKRSSHTDMPFGGYDSKEKWMGILEKIRGNNKLKALVALAVFLILTIVILLIIALFPLIMKLLNYISQNGIQGVADSITGFLDKLLKGSGK
jgi:hypothetical protein